MTSSSLPLLHSSIYPTTQVQHSEEMAPPPNRPIPGVRASSPAVAPTPSSDAQFQENPSSASLQTVSPFHTISTAVSSSSATISASAARYLIPSPPSMACTPFHPSSSNAPLSTQSSPTQSPRRRQIIDPNSTPSSSSVSAMRTIMPASSPMMSPHLSRIVDRTTDTLQAHQINLLFEIPEKTVSTRTSLADSSFHQLSPPSFHSQPLYHRCIRSPLSQHFSSLPTHRRAHQLFATNGLISSSLLPSPPISPSTDQSVTFPVDISPSRENREQAARNFFSQQLIMSSPSSSLGSTSCSSERASLSRTSPPSSRSLSRTSSIYKFPTASSYPAIVSSTFQSTLISSSSAHQTEACEVQASSSSSSSSTQIVTVTFPPRCPTSAGERHQTFMNTVTPPFLRPMTDSTSPFFS